MEMIPPLLVKRARDQGLDMIGIADHNSAANAQAVIDVAGPELVVKPGMEIETRETVHIVCLFDGLEQALSLQALVYDHLPLSPPDGRDPFGPRILVDPSGREVGREERPLFAATDLPLSEAVGAARERGGLVIASHVERRAHGLLGVLGFLPPDVRFDGLEGGPGGLSSGRIASSDAHRLADIGSRYTLFEAEGPSVEDLRRCILGGSFRTGVVV